MIYFLILVQVSFQQNSYSVNEGSAVSVSVVSSQARSQQYTINIVSRDNTARGIFIYILMYDSHVILLLFSW